VRHEGLIGGGGGARAGGLGGTDGWRLGAFDDSGRRGGEQGCTFSGCRVTFIREISACSVAGGRAGSKRACLWTFREVTGGTEDRPLASKTCVEVGHDCEGEGWL